MTEWESFLETWEREYQTTMKVLRSFPSEQRDFKPHEKSRNAANLAEGFAVEEAFMLDILKGQIDFTKMRYKNLSTWEGILGECEKVHNESISEAKALGEKEFEKSVMFMTAPGKMEEKRRGSLCWMMLYDLIHHRGQFSVYLRMVGGKVPSIYGPSYDERWV